PGALATMTRDFSVTSSGVLQVPRLDFIPPVIMQSLPNVAEPTPLVGLEYKVTYLGPNGNFQALLDANDPTGPLAAQRLVRGGTAPIDYIHPVFTYTVCGGNEALQEMRVVQSVMTTDTDASAATYELIQKFRVPVETKVGWVEFALDRANWSAPLDNGRVR